MAKIPKTYGNKTQRKRGVSCLQVLCFFLEKVGYDYREVDFKKYRKVLGKEKIPIYSPLTYIDLKALFEFMTLEGHHLSPLYWQGQRYRKYCEDRKQKWSAERSVIHEHDRLALMEVSDKRRKTLLRRRREKVFYWSFVLHWWRQEIEGENEAWLARIREEINKAKEEGKK